MDSRFQEQTLASCALDPAWPKISEMGSGVQGLGFRV